MDGMSEDWEIIVGIVLRLGHEGIATSYATRARVVHINRVN